MSLECTHCQATIALSTVDQSRQIATCGSCGHIVDLSSQLGESTSKPRLRDPVDLPAGITMRKWWMGKVGEGPGGLEIKRRWLRNKHFGFLVVLLALTAFVGHLWTTMDSSMLLIVATIALAVWDIRLLTMFVNSTTIRVEGDQIDVRHGPLPTILFRNQTVNASGLEQLFAAKWGAKFEVGAKLRDGSKISLVRPLINESQALYIEQRLERQLGIVDFEVDGELDGQIDGEVDGELDSARLPPGTPGPVSSGAGGAIAILPILLGVSVFFFFSSFASSLEGSFALSGDLGNATFTPDSCESGQLKGFLGAELTSDATPGTIVRAMRDPTRGTLLVVERGGQKPVVFTPEQCTSLQVSVSRTGTNINQVWVVQGRAVADCPGLNGTVTFDGCH